MAFNLQEVLKSLLFASPGSLSVKDIQGVFTRFHEESAELPGLHSGAETADGEPPPEPVPAADVPSLVTASQIRDAMEEIRAGLESSGEVYRLQETHSGWRLVTSASLAEWVRLLRKQPKPLKLSQSALETLSIIAYRQPVVRAEIESIRGVSADSPINRLLERELIRITGRADLPGRPIQYGTTDAFLEFVGIRSLDQLPASDVLSAREIDEWLERASATHVVDDSVLGLDTESGDEEADLELEPESRSPEETEIAEPDAPDHSTGLDESDEVDAGEANDSGETTEQVGRVTVRVVGDAEDPDDTDSDGMVGNDASMEAKLTNPSAR